MQQAPAPTIKHTNKNLVLIRGRNQSSYAKSYALALCHCFSFFFLLLLHLDFVLQDSVMCLGYAHRYTAVNVWTMTCDESCTITM